MKKLSEIAHAKWLKESRNVDEAARYLNDHGWSTEAIYYILSKK